MFLLGHLGIGRRLAHYWEATLPSAALAVGTLLPDMLDKPLYYSRLWPYVTCTRTFGHTGLLVLLLTAAGVWRRSRALKALAAGTATHLLLDLVGDLVGGPWESSTLIAVAWPLSGGRFYDSYMPSIAAHAAQLVSVPIVAGELIGGWLLWREWTRRRLPATAGRGPSNRE